MGHQGKAPVFRVLLCSALIFGAIGCSGFRNFSIQSAPSNPPIIIDGSLNDWTGRLYYVGNELVSVGMADDGESLYIGLAVDDPDMIKQLRRAGLTLWFDPQGGTKKVFGIQFPVRLSGGPEGRWKEGRRSGNRPPAGGREMDRAAPPELEESREFNFIHDKITAPIRMEPETGIEIKTGYSTGRFEYEARIPLVKTPDRPWAVGIGNMGIIGVGLQTADFDSSSGRGGGPGGGEPGEGPGGGGGMGRGAGRGGGMGGGHGMGRESGRMRGESDSSSRKLKLWAFVTLTNGSGARISALWPEQQTH